MAPTVEEMLDEAGIVIVSKEDWKELQTKLAKLEKITAELTADAL